jgi:hypothetical protein
VAFVAGIALSCAAFAHDAAPHVLGALAHVLPRIDKP